MSKSYTLADGTTVTVTATENGVPFNEGMQALTKAIKARVAVRDGSGTGAVTLNVDTSHIQSAGSLYYEWISTTTIDNGKRIEFWQTGAEFNSVVGYIDVTY